MSCRTFICIPCRTSRRAEAAYGLNTELRCSKCRGHLWELEWRWRIPRKNDDDGWRKLELKVAQDARELIPKRQKIGTKLLTEIDQQIQNMEKLKSSEKREPRLKQLLAKRRKTEKSYAYLPSQ